MLLLSKRLTCLLVMKEYYPGAECGLEHYLLNAKIMVLAYNKKKRRQDKDERIEELDNVRFNIKDEITRGLYQNRLNEKLEKENFLSTIELYK